MLVKIDPKVEKRRGGNKVSWLLFRFNCKTVRTGHERLFRAPEAWTQDDERVGEGFTNCRHLNLASL